jgi:hypothetical protein
MDRPTVLTEADRDSIIGSPIRTLTGKYDSLSGDEHLMDESLSLECIYNTIESSEIHPGFSLLPDEFFAEV